MKICISSGHGKYIRGASGYPVPPQLDEVDEARRVVNRVAELWGASGVQVNVFHDNTSHDQNTNLNTIVNHHNAQTRDLDVSVHFNAYDGSAHGTEVLYVTQSSLATKVCNAICAAGNFSNRGGKYRSDLFFLNNTEEPAILLEVCFCDNTGDSNAYRANFEAICEAIAEAISGQEIETEPPAERPPIDRPGRPPESEEENRFVMTLQCYGDMVVNINGERFVAGDQPENCPVINMNLAVPEHAEDLVIQINGQDFHGPFEPSGEQPSSAQRNIFATTFGGTADNEYSCYGPYDAQGRGPYLDDTDFYVALPWKWPSGDRPRVRVTRSDLSIEASIMDVGPWMIDDPYWEVGGRPVAETCYDNHDPLPSGPNEGRVPANPAGIDLSPALFKALGMQDNDLVDWEFVDEAVA